VDESSLNPALACTIPGFLLPATATFTPQDSSSVTSIVRSRLSIISSHRHSLACPTLYLTIIALTLSPPPIFTHTCSPSPDCEFQAAETVSPAPILQNLHSQSTSKWLMLPETNVRRRFSYTPYKRTLRCLKWR
jgi:hypothetical protein